MQFDAQRQICPSNACVAPSSRRPRQDVGQFSRDLCRNTSDQATSQSTPSQTCLPGGGLAGTYTPRHPLAITLPIPYNLHTVADPEFRPIIRPRFTPRAWSLLTLLALALTPAVHAAVIYVDWDSSGGGNDGTSWTKAFPTINEALTAASFGDEIWVTGNGTYTEAITMVSDVSLYGGFDTADTQLSDRDPDTNVTTIDATGLFASVVTLSSVSNTHLEGFTITGAESESFFDCFGVEASSSDNTNAIVDCKITGNTRGSGLSGGGLYFSSSSVSITDCIIADNHGNSGGRLLLMNSSPAIDNCVISGNTASTGGGIYNGSGSSPTIMNTIISYNTAGFGGGIVIEFGSPVITNCTISDNTAYQANEGGGIRMVFGSVNATVTNTIFYNNTNYAVAEVNGEGTFTNCLFYNNPDSDYYDEGTTPVNGAAAINALGTNSGNVDGNPLFVKAVVDDYRLQAGSAAIDAGNATGAPSDDIEGYTRPKGAVHDIGAHESYSVSDEAEIVRYDFADVDTDNDGLISEDEWAAAGYDPLLFSKFTGFGDGYLTMTELMSNSGLTPNSLATVYVNFDAVTAGNGTGGSPVRTIAEALALVALDSNGVISILPGNGTETFTAGTAIDPTAKITFTRLNEGAGTVQIGIVP